VEDGVTVAHRPDVVRPATPDAGEPIRPPGWKVVQLVKDEVVIQAGERMLVEKAAGAEGQVLRGTEERRWWRSCARRQLGQRTCPLTWIVSAATATEMTSETLVM
jgi:hypothetical protein